MFLNITNTYIIYLHIANKHINYSTVRTVSGTFLIFTAKNQLKTVNAIVTATTGKTTVNISGFEEKLLIPASFIIWLTNGSVRISANTIPIKPPRKETTANRKEKVICKQADEKPIAL